MRGAVLRDIHSNRGNHSRQILYDNLMKFRDVFPEALPCELPKEEGNRHEIDLKRDLKYCVMKQWPLPGEHLLAIIVFCRLLRSRSFKEVEPST